MGFSRQEYWQEWVAISFSRGSSWPRDRTRVSCIAGRFFIIWATSKAQNLLLGALKCSYIWNHFDIKHLTLLVIVSTSGLFPCTPCEFRLGLYSLELNLWNVFEAWVKATFLWRGFVFVVLGTWVPSTRNYLKFSLGDFQTTQGLKSVWRPSPGYDSLGEIIFLLGAVKGSPLVHAV